MKTVNIIFVLLMATSGLAHGKVTEDEATKIATIRLEGLEYWLEDFTYPSTQLTGYSEYQLKKAPIVFSNPNKTAELKPIEPQGGSTEAYFISAYKSGDDGLSCWGRVWVAADSGRILPRVRYREVYWNGSFSHEFYNSGTVKRWPCKVYEPDGIPFP